MCTLTHFAQPLAASPISPSSMLQRLELSPHLPETPRFQVLLAGNAFFHIKEISTGHVRGFRIDHNEACALARALESHG
ncbi:hypothetical protein DKY63_07715 [Pseudomonas putida]|uniref:Uncharacterized protein n=1 Tax=Pseudomonas putida TaxID=303 RepID=A0A2Z4RII8_PSEPU|nr:hypothetical protein [Pseudomonas putida]AWY39794.1 hypothetical protein DKY63_07715 [Pseudomonas putida]